MPPRKKSRTARAVDMYCGGGGSTSGFYAACKELDLKTDVLGINHWPVAVETHKANHPDARHLCETMDSVCPRTSWEGKLHVLIAGPECVHFSVARGGKPCSDQSRASAWHVVRWAEVHQPDAIIVENVREFTTWGPLDNKQRPMKSKRGETFSVWLDALRSLNYTVDWRIINAADYGDPTTRKRFFLIGLRGKNRKIPWPEPTHSKHPIQELFASTEKWRAAREVIDWSLKGESIFKRKRPLSPNTLRRIEAGLKKFCGIPFVVNLSHTSAPDTTYCHDTENPLPTITSLQEHGVVATEPFLTSFKEGIERRVHDADSPLPTQTAGGKQFALCEPFVVSLRGTDEDQLTASVKSVEDPVPAVTASGLHNAVIEPFICSAGGPKVDARAVSDPMNTVLTRDHMAVVEPFIVPTNYGEREGQAPRIHSIDQPYPTVTAGGVGHAVCEPFLIKYYGTGGAHDVENPLDTVTARDRFGLVLPDGRLLDIRFRMLQPHELAAAMSFPPGYIFKGNKSDVVRQIGNGWAGMTAKALCKAVLEVLF